MKTLTVFTPTYNRAHTLGRTYKSLCQQTCKDFEWMIIDDGSTDNTYELVQRFIEDQNIQIRYIHKENGGLYTGYNTAYLNINTILNVCIDSDDLMPDNAVELILKTWKERGSDKYAGIIGLDYYLDSNKPIGGKFPENLKECFYLDLYTHRIHRGDSKLVMRTDFMKEVAPQIGFEGEKDFNPVYMLLQVCDKYPLIVLNENLCYVEYLQNGMSSNMFKQYINSPRSYAKCRLLEMQLKHNTVFNKCRLAVHYVSSCLISKDRDWLNNSPYKILTILAAPLGLLLYIYIIYKKRCLHIQ